MAFDYERVASDLMAINEGIASDVNDLNLNRVYPVDPESRDDVLAIDRRTKEDLRLKHRLYMEADWDCNTVAHAVLANMIRVLNAEICHHGVSILDSSFDNVFPFYDLISISASNKKNTSAEKMGNINVKFIPGARVPSIIADNTDNDGKDKIEYIKFDECYKIEDNESATSAMLKIDTMSRREMSDRYKIIMPKDWEAVAVTYVFLEDLYRHIIMKLVASKKNQVMINFNDLIEFHAQKKGDCAQIFIRPGYESKLIIKSDKASEEDDRDDDE